MLSDAESRQVQVTRPPLQHRVSRELSPGFPDKDRGTEFASGRVLMPEEVAAGLVVNTLWLMMRGSWQRIVKGQIAWFWMDQQVAIEVLAATYILTFTMKEITIWKMRLK
jgi:hypothetical protein